MSYRRMTFRERMSIFNMLYVQRQKPSKIASNLNRSVSTITREIERGLDAGDYNPLISEYEYLKMRRHQSPKLKIDREAWRLIKPKLEYRWPPDEIAKCLKIEYPYHAMSGKTIYNYLHFHMRGELKKLALKNLRQHGRHRKVVNSDEKRGKLKDITLNECPPEVNSRTVPGHWEGDST